MTGSLDKWILLVLVARSQACIDADGNFTCQTAWYFWFAIFCAFLVLFIVVVCVVNHCNKKKNAVDSTATPRVLSAINKERRRGRTSSRGSDTSDWNEEHSKPANQEPRYP
ncbi:uncharacterized protein LOC124146755 [Haliotis rufescens]|uniref:uncharacterized protein LOC124146755 n=1 Tax=Haliotis rufescens TaxID=6454 RepID=UPI00201E89DE|nr:uncharacterized protein LOC124146755 [Haliotis rufescens]